MKILNKQIIFGGIAGVAVLLGGFFLLRPQTSAPQPEQTAQPTETVQEQTATDSSVMGEVVEFIVTSKGLKFEPTELKVKQGDKVKITYKNTVGSHDFVIDEFNVNTNIIDAGQEVVVEFIADKKGSFEYYCSVPGHRAAGMKGTLVVE